MHKPLLTLCLTLITLTAAAEAPPDAALQGGAGAAHRQFPKQLRACVYRAGEDFSD